MNIYIPDIELPKDEPRTYTAIVMYVGADGKLRAECEGTHEVTIVPPHGRLIDADELLRAALEYFFFDFVPRWMVKEAPTVIPADKDGET